MLVLWQLLLLRMCFNNYQYNRRLRLMHSRVQIIYQILLQDPVLLSRYPALLVSPQLHKAVKWALLRPLRQNGQSRFYLVAAE